METAINIKPKDEKSLSPKKRAEIDLREDKTPKNQPE